MLAGAEGVSCRGFALAARLATSTLRVSTARHVRSPQRRPNVPANPRIHVHFTYISPSHTTLHLARPAAAVPSRQVAARTGIPVDQQRYWVWRRRSNSTFRPERPLTAAEEAGQLVDLKDIRDMPREGPGGYMNLIYWTLRTNTWLLDFAEVRVSWWTSSTSGTCRARGQVRESYDTMTTRHSHKDFLMCMPARGLSDRL